MRRGMKWGRPMHRLALLVALLASSTSAPAGIGAEIAYSVGREIYLVNADGSGKRLLYRGPTKTSIFAISMKKDGGELSFEEASSTGQTGQLVTIAYGNSGMGQVIRSVPGCRFDVDTRPDGALLVVELNCGGVVKYAAPGSSNLQPVGVPRQASKVAWMPDGSFLYAAEGKIWQATLSSPSGTAIANQDCVQSINTANAASEALVAVGQVCNGPRIDRMLVPSGTATHIAAGPDAAYSQDDKCYLFVAPPQRRGSFLLMARIDGVGSSVQVGNSANYGSVDWRGDSQPGSCGLLTSGALQFREVKSPQW